MRQVVRQPLDVFAPLLLEALHFDDLGVRAIGANEMAKALSGQIPIRRVSALSGNEAKILIPAFECAAHDSPECSDGPPDILC